jgi:proteic killer suppression protein
MQVRHLDGRLARMEQDSSYHGPFGADVAKAFRKRMQFIRAAEDERAFYAMKSLHYEKLKGDRSEQRSIRLNEQWRLILRIEAVEQRTVVVIDIEDYH